MIIFSKLSYYHFRGINPISSSATKLYRLLFTQWTLKRTIELWNPLLSINQPTIILTWTPLRSKLNSNILTKYCNHHFLLKYTNNWENLHQNSPCSYFFFLFLLLLLLLLRIYPNLCSTDISITKCCRVAHVSNTWVKHTCVFLKICHASACHVQDGIAVSVQIDPNFFLHPLTLHLSHQQGGVIVVLTEAARHAPHGKRIGNSCYI